MSGFNPRYPTLQDLCVKAKKKIPGFAFDYLESGAGEEQAVHRNSDAWKNIMLCQHTMRDVSKLDCSIDLFGHRYSYPFGVAPMGAGNIIWPGAETALASAAHRANIPYILSMMSSTLLEEIAEVSEGDAWFQIYPTTDWDISFDLLDRAKVSGYNVLLITVDVPVMPKREREMRNGLQNKLSSLPKILWDASTHPEWSLRTLMAGKPKLINISRYIPNGSKDRKSIAKFMRSVLSIGASRDYIQRIRDNWEGTLIIKGILSPDDAIDAISMGVDGVIVSNHGGRVMEAAEPTPLVLPRVTKAVGDKTTIIVDSGARSGLDIMKGLSLGAHAVLLGRPFLFSVGALGTQGAFHVMALLQDECERAMRQLGITELDRNSLNMITTQTSFC